MHAIRLALGLLLSLLAFALMNAASNDYTTLFAIATGLSVLGILSLEGPARISTGRTRIAARAILGFGAVVAAYGAVALTSMLLAGE